MFVILLIMFFVCKILMVVLVFNGLKGEWWILILCVEFKLLGIFLSGWFFWWMMMVWMICEL